MAKSEGLPGWHSMRKDELVRALGQALPGESKKPAGDGGSWRWRFLPSSSPNAWRKCRPRNRRKAQEQLRELREKMA